MTRVAQPGSVTENTDGAPCACKAGRLVDTWNLSAVHEDLVSRWKTGRVSLREAARALNRAALRTAVTVETDIAPLDGEVENLYRLLTDEDVSEGMRVQTRNRLERSGLDVVALTDSFVSYQTVNRHFRDCVGVVRDETAELDRKEAEDRIFQLQSRLESVTASTLDQLDRSDHLDIDDPAVYVNVQVSCRTCDTQYSVDSLLEIGHCECDL